ncbi:MAG: PAS domain-containing protein [Bacteroidetes bacterium]|nr:PAS domain-containing protein [Bacteroidota bacterium]
MAFATIALRTRTAESEAEKDTHATRLYVRSLIEASLDPLLAVNHEGKIIDANNAAEKATGRTKAELVGTDFADYFTEPVKARAGLAGALSNGFVGDCRLTVNSRSGNQTDVLCNASVYRNESGKPLGIFVSVHDVSYKKLDT